ncbi:MAG: N-acetylmuramoyl-L-alanine amidase [Verrucomicrobia bacterium]|nr:N-acetylmuramoyl-L-alanine amidase [Verrucomicrobiota bacterium]
MGRWRALVVGVVVLSAFLIAAPSSGGDELTFKKDSRGEYASYRLKKGETIWTHVVRRFTSRTDDVNDNEASRLILERSGFGDERKIPDGAEMKIPVELLAPEFLGQQVKEVSSGSRPLAGVVIIFDPGHGGVDPGATPQTRIFEDEIVYDIMCRAKRILERDTAATVHVTVRDRSRGFAVTAERNRFPQDGDEEVLTTPNYRITSTVVALHLRWYLANSLYRKALARGVRADRVLFTSFHADDLPRNLRGAMVYIPGARLREGTYGKSGRPYTQFAEWRERPNVAFTKRERATAEALSKAFAEELTRSLKASSVMVFANKPIRDHIQRGNAFVPAVLRYNAVPTAVLIECGNLSNVRDRQNLCDPTFRERFAQAYVNAVIAYMRKR